MTFTKSRFASFEAYLATEFSDLPEGFYEYWDGELVKIMPESIFNDGLANRLMILLMTEGILIDLIRPGGVEVCVPGKPRTRFPDMTILDEIHLTLLKNNARITQAMPPPRILVEVVSPGNETSDNYLRDYQDKPKQYAAIGVPEMWRIDPDRAWVQIGTLTDGDYQFETFQGAQSLVSNVFPDLKLTAQQVLSGDRNG